MKNLKRALSLALASIMLLGMMVVGAGAVEFNDADKIENTEAVNTMVALGVLKGKDTGDFDPAGLVTRAEMAKMICVMLSGGKEPNLGTSSAAYPDTGSHWANSYIAYCANLGIVAGDNHGNFNPDATVTGTEAAKTLLVALGYDSDVFAFTGAAWAINVNTQASKVKLYDNMDVSADKGLSRDNAAQMAFNALSAFIMEKTYDKVQSNGEISYNYVLSTTTTFLNEYFDGKIFVGTMTGNYNTGASTNKGEVQVVGKLDTAAEDASNLVANFPSDLAIANIGEQVKVIFKDGKGGNAGRPDKNDTIYGAFNTGNTEVYEVTKADIQDAESTTKIKFGGNKYDVASAGVDVVYNYITGTETHYADAAALQAALKVQSVDDIKFVTNTDGKIFKAYVTAFYAGKVTGLTSTKITISGVGSIVLEDNDVAEDLAKDDVVGYTKFYDADKDDAFFTVTKAETIEGELTGFKLDGGTPTYKNVVVDGTTYKVETPAIALANLTDDAITAPTSANIGDTVRVHLVKGMAVALQTIEGGNGQYALITECTTTTGAAVGSNMNPLKVTVLLADGTKETVNVHKDSTKNGTDKFDAEDSADQMNLVPAGTLVEYTSLANGSIKIKSVKGAATAITAGSGNVWNKDAKTLVYTGTTSAVAATEAVAYVKVNTSYYAYNLRGLGNIANTPGTGVKVSSYLDDGLVVAAFLELGTKPGSSTADTLYGIVTGYNGTRTIDDETYYQYTIAVGEDEDVIVNADDNTTLAAGKLVKFDETTDGKYDANISFEILVANTDTALAGSVIGAVKEYNESSRLLTYYTGLTRGTISAAFTGTVASITVDKDVKIVYVNAKDNKAGEDIGVAAFDAATGYANVVFHKDSDGIVDAIIVETSGKANLASVASNKDVATSAFGSTAGVTLSVPTSIAASAGTNASYTVTTNKPTPAVGESFTITVTLAGGIDAANSKETVSVTYNGTTTTLDFTAAATKTASFTAVVGQTAVTLSVAPTAI